jgi:hypothetical protein
MKVKKIQVKIQSQQLNSGNGTADFTGLHYRGFFPFAFNGEIE